MGMVEKMLGKKLLKGTEEIDTASAFGDKTAIALYFSAHWCPPCRGFTPKLRKCTRRTFPPKAWRLSSCRQIRMRISSKITSKSSRGFTPQLAAWYKMMKPELKDKFEIIFCSGDREEEAMKSYYKEQCDAGGDWLCLPFANKDNLDDQFEVSGIPTFIIVDPSGKVINKSGRSLVPDAVAAEFPWAPGPIGNLEQPEGINETLSMCLMLEACDEDLQKRIMTAVEPIAKKYAEAEDDDKKVLFFAAKKKGSVSAQIRGMTGLEGVETLSKNETSATVGPKLIRTVSSDTPTIILFNLSDNGGYYVGKMAKALDGSGIQRMLDDFFDGKLERKQLS